MSMGASPLYLGLGKAIGWTSVHMVLHDSMVWLLSTVAGCRESSHIFHYLFIKQYIMKNSVEKIYSKNIPLITATNFQLLFLVHNQLPFSYVTFLSDSEHIYLSMSICI